MSIVGEFVVSDLRNMEYVIPDLKKVLYTAILLLRYDA